MIVDFLQNASHKLYEGYSRIIFNGLDDSRNYSINFSHFVPINQWSKAQGNLYIIDKSNNDKYFNDSPRVKRLKCLALVAVTPIVHAISTVLNIANRIVKLGTAAHFWYPIENRAYSLHHRLVSFAKDLIIVAFAPIIYVGLELSAIYGLALPYDGGKLYATFERCAFGRSLAAPCFQPSPFSHLGGGDINQPNNW